MCVIFLETIKDPKLLIKKLKQEKEQINELVSQGEVEKAEELKKNIAWQKAFDKTDGKKVCTYIYYGCINIMKYVNEWMTIDNHIDRYESSEGLKYIILFWIFRWKIT